MQDSSDARFIDVKYPVCCMIDYSSFSHACLVIYLDCTAEIDIDCFEAVNLKSKKPD